MQTFEQLITVSQDDLDDLNHVNNVRYVQWVQDIAKAHWLKNASKEILDNYFWVVVSHHIEYKSSALLNDVIQLKTYVTKSEGVTSTRVVEMYHKETRKLLVKAETVWCLIGTKSKRPVRIHKEIVSLFS